MMQRDQEEALRELLAWQLELGADEAIGDEPIDRFALPERRTEPRRRAAGGRPAAPSAPERGPSADAAPAAAETVDAVAEAERLAAAARTLEELREAIDADPHLELRKGARNLVFADGMPGARVMIIGEAPGRDEDLQGLPFVGRAGRLLDRMFAAIGLSRRAPDREHALYITNILPWRPPQNRDPTPREIAMMRPFVLRHIELADPELLVLMGNTPCAALLGTRGISRLRGRWHEVAGRPALPMFHPAYLLRNPAAKRLAWQDLLMLAERLEGPAPES